MSTITRTWLAFAAIGTGLIHFALVIGSPLPLGIVFAIFGLVEFGWGVFTFARESFPAPRAVLGGAMVPIVAWALLLVAATASGTPGLAASVPFFPLAIATVLGLFIAVTVAIHLRRAPNGSSGDAPARTPGVGRYLLSLLAGGLIVAALTTPALAATPAGANAHPHGEHIVEFVIPHLH